jgi:hypothetical protein
MLSGMDTCYPTVVAPSADDSSPRAARTVRVGAREAKDIRAIRVGRSPALRGGDLTLWCSSGVAWVTIEGDVADVVLHAGQSIAIPRDERGERKVVVQALSDHGAVVRITRPR